MKTLAKRMLVFAVLLLPNLNGCRHTKSDQKKAADRVQLPQPERVVRRQGGWSIVSTRAEINLKTGEGRYTKRTEGAVDCDETFNILAELEVWRKAVTETDVCFGEGTQQATDSSVNVLTFVYPAATTLPAEVNVTVEANEQEVHVSQRFDEYALGRQQFGCRGEFEIDALLKAKVACLKQ